MPTAASVRRASPAVSAAGAAALAACLLPIIARDARAQTVIAFDSLTGASAVAAFAPAADAPLPVSFGDELTLAATGTLSSFAYTLANVGPAGAGPAITGGTLTVDFFGPDFAPLATFSLARDFSAAPVTAGTFLVDEITGLESLLPTPVVLSTPNLFVRQTFAPDAPDAAVGVVLFPPGAVGASAADFFFQPAGEDPTFVLPGELGLTGDAGPGYRVRVLSAATAVVPEPGAAALALPAVAAVLALRRVRRRRVAK